MDDENQPFSLDRPRSMEEMVKILTEKDKIIEHQTAKLARLQQELKEVSLERDDLKMKIALLNLTDVNGPIKIRWVAIFSGTSRYVCSKIV